MSLTLETPLSGDKTKNLRVGDIVYISGIIYTARDSAHKRIVEEGAPVDLNRAVIFHAGPIIKSSEDGYEMVAVGPTTSTRMNPYEPSVINMGVGGIIGKGGMDKATSQALVDNEAVYLTAVGGCAAHYVKSVLGVRDVHWLDLGVPEAVWELEVEKFGPLIVTMDSEGGNLYEKVKKRRTAQAQQYSACQG
ncbi:FumA C-terminus/TtdB family hydratase beta subunit [Methanobacterium paludis]|uniref:Hydro-lyase, Fe-S type, tartrate/fumarate subfamily, beta subunit n=1 Tax=Methanobacterium paludis (strain DSM 25820 / JCM 18151 / SWAN1) TaxID=868131 RepID=F6D7Z1_METPW|nr:FumA C-terminus/TtdB family hydratase beta subunit [Methanobacterium paludis]AEG18514.1 hydro-lyase, Fe-S type, tartrate/fumarate subfamily, beta subunit [Methanobacterium paludis]